MKYDLVIVSMEAFPQGMAATNRILSYAKGIAKEHKVLFLTYAGPAYGDTSNMIQKGIYEGIEFRYMHKPYLFKRPNKLVRAILLIYRVLKIHFLALFVYKYKSMLLYTHDTELTKRMRYICNLKNSFLYSDITEAVGYYKGEKEIKARQKSNKCLDGVITISKGIYDDFLSNIDTNKKILIPVLVDFDRFPLKKEERDNYFFCCSGANLERDGLLDCLNAFLLFNRNNPGYKFVIASSLNMNDSYHQQCKKIMDDNKNVIEYIGSIPANEIPGKLMKATALMLTPHKNYLTKGFPTKLGEYLASGTPVICSRIDDLAEVVEEDCVFWTSPNRPDEICEQLEYIIQNPVHAKEVGLAGRNMMEKHYTYEAYKNSLLEFLKI